MSTPPLSSLYFVIIVSYSLFENTSFTFPRIVIKKVIFLKFLISSFLGTIWLGISLFFAVGWAKGIPPALPSFYVWWVILGIAILPGFFMSIMFFSNLLHWRFLSYPDTAQDTTILMSARNEETHITDAIQAILRQHYKGKIHLLVLDNCSTDRTKEKILNLKSMSNDHCSIKYIYCPTPGKAHALNTGLLFVHTPYFMTVDADTILEPHAVQKIMNHIVACKSACVAGNILVRNAKQSFASRMQTYDYLLSIASVKRFQGSYRSTLVAQGAFSVYQTNAVRHIGGWNNVLGEDIVLTYQFLQNKFPSTYEPKAVGYTIVPETIRGLFHQRKRWAIGMLEGLSTVPPWKQGSVYSVFFTTVNCFVIYLDLAFLFGFLPGVVLAFFGYFYFVGYLTFVSAAISALLYLCMYAYQKRIGVPFQTTFWGFLSFFLFFQPLQSMASLFGYLSKLLGKKTTWNSRDL